MRHSPWLTLTLVAGGLLLLGAVATIPEALRPAGLKLPTVDLSMWASDDADLQVIPESDSVATASEAAELPKAARQGAGAARVSSGRQFGIPKVFAGA